MKTAKPKAGAGQWVWQDKRYFQIEQKIFDALLRIEKKLKPVDGGVTQAQIDAQTDKLVAETKKLKDVLNKK